MMSATFHRPNPDSTHSSSSSTSSSFKKAAANSTNDCASTSSSSVPLSSSNITRTSSSETYSSLNTMNDSSNSSPSSISKISSRPSPSSSSTSKGYQISLAPESFNFREPHYVFPVLSPSSKARLLKQFNNDSPLPCSSSNYRLPHHLRPQEERSRYLKYLETWGGGFMKEFHERNARKRLAEEDERRERINLRRSRKWNNVVESNDEDGDNDLGVDDVEEDKGKFSDADSFIRTNEDEEKDQPVQKGKGKMKENAQEDSNYLVTSLRGQKRYQIQINDVKGKGKELPTSSSTISTADQSETLIRLPKFASEAERSRWKNYAIESYWAESDSSDDDDDEENEEDGVIENEAGGESSRTKKKRKRSRLILKTDDGLRKMLKGLDESGPGKRNRNATKKMNDKGLVSTDQESDKRKKTMRERAEPIPSPSSRPHARSHNLSRTSSSSSSIASTSRQPSFLSTRPSAPKPNAQRVSHSPSSSSLASSSRPINLKHASPRKSSAVVSSLLARLDSSSSLSSSSSSSDPDSDSDSNDDVPLLKRTSPTSTRKNSPSMPRTHKDRAEESSKRRIAQSSDDDDEEKVQSHRARARPRMIEIDSDEEVVVARYLQRSTNPLTCSTLRINPTRFAQHVQARPNTSSSKETAPSTSNSSSHPQASFSRSKKNQVSPASLQKLNAPLDDGLRKLMSSISPESKRKRSKAPFVPDGFKYWGDIVTKKSPRKEKEMSNFEDRGGNSQNEREKGKEVEMLIIDDLSEEKDQDVEISESETNDDQSNIEEGTPVLDLMAGTRLLNKLNDNGLMRLLSGVEVGAKRKRRKRDLGPCVTWKEALELKNQAKQAKNDSKRRTRSLSFDVTSGQSEIDADLFGVQSHGIVSSSTHSTTHPRKTNDLSNLTPPRNKIRSSLTVVRSAPALHCQPVTSSSPTPSPSKAPTGWSSSAAFISSEL